MTRRGIVDDCLALMEPSGLREFRTALCSIAMLYHKRVVSVIRVLLNVLIDVTIVYKYQIINEGDHDRLEGSPMQYHPPY